MNRQIEKMEQLQSCPQILKSNLNLLNDRILNLGCGIATVQGMSEPLKPCPFCGGEAVIFHGAFETTSAKCLRCGVETELFNDSPSSSGKQKAISAWNRRTPDTGNPVTENKPLSLEELRGMDREPVWCVSLTGITRPDMWCIYSKRFDRCSDGEWDFYVDGEPDEIYGKTWLAYRRKPEREGEG